MRAGLLTAGQPWRSVWFEPQTGSTNEVARNIVTASSVSPHHRSGGPGPAWQVVLTDHQTGGRGRLGRQWQVPAGAAVAVSVIVPVRDRSAAPWLPLCAGLALSRSLQVVTRTAGHELRPRLKWPNDVLLADDDDRKVSGILCELLGPLADGDRGGEDGVYVVIGTGINVDQTRAELPVDTATSVALAGATVSREALVVSYLRELAGLLGSAGPHERVVRAEYERACSTIGARVRVHLPGGVTVDGEATGIDRTGALVVRTTSGTRTFAAGDVEHVRRPDGRLA